MSLREPWMLLALLPAAAVLVLAGRALRRGGGAGAPAAFCLRLLAALALGLAAAGLAVRSGGRPKALVLMDRSASTRSSGASAARPALEAARVLERRFDVSFASFAMNARSEPQGALAALPPDESGTDIAAALVLAAESLAPGEPAVLVSDGLATVPGAREAALGFAGGGPALVVLPAGPAGPDAALAELDAPAESRPGAAVRIAVRVAGCARGPVAVTLTREDGTTRREIGRRELRLPDSGWGAASCVFEDEAPDSGTVWYTAGLSAEGDIEPANNARRAGMRVVGPVRAAVLGSRSAGAATMLAAVGVQSGAALEALPASLTGVDVVVIDDLPRERLSSEDCRRLAAFIGAGGGVVTLGGPQAYASGGWHNGGELERGLPASMVPPDDKGLLAVLVLDRSGSMGQPLPGGGTKLDLVKNAAREILSEGSFEKNDRLAIVGFSDRPGEPVGPVQPNEAGGAERLRAALDAFVAGGSTDLAAALERACGMVDGTGADRIARHVLLLSDGVPVGPGAAGQRSRLLELASSLAAGGATLSTVGTGSSDEDARLLEDLARLGRGRFYRPDDLKELGAVFRRDLAERRAEVAAGRFAPVVTGTPLPGLTGELPELEGRNRFSAKPGAWTALEAPAAASAGREPLLVAWERGRGRAACLGTGLGGAWNSGLAGTREGAAMLGALVRWAAGRSGLDGCSLRLLGPGSAEGRGRAAAADRGASVLELSVPVGEGSEALPAAPVAELRSADGRWSQRLELVQVSPSRFAAAVAVPAGGGDLVAVAKDGGRELARAVFCASFPPELTRVGVDRAALEDLARAAGGTTISSPAELAKMDFPVARNRGLAAAAPWLAAAGLALVIAELVLRAVRRGG